ncbi:hypothetical protein MC3_04640 [Rickettsia slovaca str. D-CWPP]|uniref:Uncharacterized protein n=3 Tax=Rickettsia slovaca TaxID=35794 RepID=H8LNQ4_RICSL|nr:hypothetical protein Rsl_958 [Rickettsia slovaca 13-B]AFD19847.1 hypothetical protein MC3_04640 [Rickettsia slovaca str. D-CWPP]
MFAIASKPRSPISILLLMSKVSNALFSVNAVVSSFILLWVKLLLLRFRVFNHEFNFKADAIYFIPSPKLFVLNLKYQ